MSVSSPFLPDDQPFIAADLIEMQADGCFLALGRVDEGLEAYRKAYQLDPASLEKAAEAGADEIMDKLATPIELIGAIRRLGQGESTDDL